MIKYELETGLLINFEFEAEDEVAIVVDVNDLC